MLNKKGAVKGAKVRVVNNTAQHNLPIGSTYTVKIVNTNNTVAVNEVSQVFYLVDLELETMTKDDLKKRIDGVEESIAASRKEIDGLKARLAYLDEVGEDKYDERELKAYQTLRLLEQTNMTTLQRAKAIAGLFN